MSTVGNLFILSAPSGAGKTSLIKVLLQRNSHVCVSVSHTTRVMRAGEKHGLDYNYVHQTQFDELVAKGLMLEYARVFGNSYGTSKAWVEDTMAAGQDVILEIDWQGREQVMKILPDAIAITILPPSKSVLRTRLMARGTDSQNTINHRMEQAKNEISHYPDSHYLIVNEDFDQALDELNAIIISERLQTQNQIQQHAQLLTDLLSDDN